MERKRTSVFGIKGKLISAVAMLLVAVIMVVSSTYAWFTLSTAPEVRGIQTSIGANGALEISLNDSAKYAAKISGDADGNGTVEENEFINIENFEFGNLIDLSDAAYGLDKIVLNPATLNYVLNADNSINLYKMNTTNMLGFATYDKMVGDGRPGELNKSTIHGTYTEDKFTNNTGTGVRAVGMASGMTDEQLAYRSALGAANNAISMATTKAANSLNANGSILANAVVAYALDSGVKFDAEDVAALRAIVESFKGENGILASIEEAYVKLFIGLAASAKGSNAAYLAVKNYTKLSEIVTVAYNTTNDKIVDSVTLKGIDGFDTSKLTTEITDFLASIKAFYQTSANIAAADAELKTVETEVASATDGGVTWSSFSKPLQYMVKSDNIKVNTYTPGELKTEAGQNALMKEVAGGKGINVFMEDGAGVYEEIADHCGDYTAAILLDVKYGSLELEGIDAKMSTNSKEPSTAYLKAAQNALTLAGMPVSSSGNADLPMSEFYGYVIDLIFRTNASSSNLLLQADATDRIYKDNQNSATQGGGSYMTFTSAATDFTPVKVANLMSFIRIVFFNTDTGDIYGYAKLDVDNYTVDGAGGVTAKMYMYKYANGYKYETADGKTAYCSVVTTTNYDIYTDANKTTAADSAITLETLTATDSGYTKTEGEGYDSYTNGTDTYYVFETTSYAFYKDTDNKVVDEAAAAVLGNDTATFSTKFIPTPMAEFKLDVNGDTVNDNVIVALEQNVVKKVSTLVYLEGAEELNGVDNGDVPTTANVTGKMNLQFASSANLVPMEYGDLYTPGEKATTTTQSGN